MINLTISIIKMTEATYHEAKPEYLVYLDHSFHVLDIKVIICNKMQMFHTIITCPYCEHCPEYPECIM